jgi:hypothetical protein
MDAGTSATRKSRCDVAQLLMRISAAPTSRYRWVLEYKLHNKSPVMLEEGTCCFLFQTPILLPNSSDIVIDLGRIFAVVGFLSGSMYVKKSTQKMGMNRYLPITATLEWMMDSRRFEYLWRRT